MKPTAEFQKMVNSIAANCLSVRLRLMNRMVGAIYDEALRIHGIKASQLNILVAVSAFGRVNSRQLCQVLHMDPSTLSRAAGRLKKSGWLQVQPSGRSCTQARSTAQVSSTSSEAPAARSAVPVLHLSRCEPQGPRHLPGALDRGR